MSFSILRHLNIKIKIAKCATTVNEIKPATMLIQQEELTHTLTFHYPRIPKTSQTLLN